MQDKINDLLQLPIERSLKKNIEIIEQIIENNVDIVKREFVFHGPIDISGVVFYTDGLVNVQLIDSEILKPLMIYSSQIREQDNTQVTHFLAENIKNHLILNTAVKFVTKISDALENILSGDTLVLLDFCDQGFIASTKGWDARSVGEAETETVVRGPRDGFTESIRTNTALVRRRIRDPYLRMEAMKIGEKSKTDVHIAYVKGIVKDGIVNEVRERLQKIKIDLVLESGYIEELIRDAPNSPFSTIQSTERPDKVAAALYEGRVAIFVDNTPFVLLVPTFFWQYIQASDDYYSSFWTGSFFRLIRYIAFLISLTLPSLYVLIVSFHQEMIPTTLALTIAAGRDVSPFPALIEALVMEISFELIREAGLRIPKPIGQTVSIIGSLVIGQAAVQAGFVSPSILIIVAITGISSFAIPNYATSFALRLVRFPLLIASGTLGLMGFGAVFVMITIHVLSLRSFGEPYTAPLFPLKPSDQKDIIIRAPWWKMQKRPQMVDDNPNRSESGIKPEPPKANSGESDTDKKSNDNKNNDNNKNNQSNEKGRKVKQKRTWRK